MATKKVPPFRRVNLKLQPATHTAMSLFVQQQRHLGDTALTIQSYLHRLVVQDMLVKGFLKNKGPSSSK
jgi:hypothetical protein